MYHKDLVFSLTSEPSPTVSIVVSHTVVETMYQHMLHCQQETARTTGFSQGTVPLKYIESTFKQHIIEYLKEFFFYYAVSNFLFQQRLEQKLVIAGEPILRSITIAPGQDAIFTFDIILARPEAKIDWKKLSFKAPERKNYKDLDRQVESFIKEETEKMNRHTQDTIDIGDWVCVEFHVIIDGANTLLTMAPHVIWIKVGDEESDHVIHDMLLHKKIGESFTTTSELLQEYISPHLDTQHIFAVTILRYVPAIFFSFDNFKRHFKIKNNKEMHLKLIEVFSCRNDITQRRETIEALFKLLLNSYLIPLEESSIHKQKEQVLDIVHLNPDYHVYKAQTDFKNKVWQLAIKQLKETILIDYLAHQDQITVSDDDVVCYLNLIKRPRMKEFIYFDIAPWKMSGKDRIISHDMLRQLCLREKMLNHIIHYLTKK